MKANTAITVSALAHVLRRVRRYHPACTVYLRGQSQIDEFRTLNGFISNLEAMRSERDDPVWREAWEWVIREHEQALDASARQALLAWLKSDRAHTLSYEEACRIWLHAGLVPDNSAG